VCKCKRKPNQALRRGGLVGGAISPSSETASSSQRTPAASSAGQPSASERSQVLDGALATAPQSRARSLRLRLPGRRPTLYRLRDNRASPGAELAGASLVLGASNLVAACGRCNYGAGARIAAENTRQTIVRLHTLVWEQQAEIDRLTERLGRYEDANGDRVRRGRTPAIH
jgi:hypothetical protein